MGLKDRITDLAARVRCRKTVDLSNIVNQLEVTESIAEVLLEYRFEVLVDLTTPFGIFTLGLYDFSTQRIIKHYFGHHSHDSSTDHSKIHQQLADDLLRQKYNDFYLGGTVKAASYGEPRMIEKQRVRPLKLSGEVRLKCGYLENKAIAEQE